MQVRDVTTVEQFLTHFHDQVSSDITDQLVIVLDRIQPGREMLRDGDLAPLGPSQEGRVGSDRHDPGNNGHVHARSSNLGTPVDEIINIVKHLSDDEVAAGVDLLLQILEIKLHVFVRQLRMALRVAGNADSEMVTVLGLDILNQVLGILEATFNGSPVFCVPRRISSQR